MPNIEALIKSIVEPLVEYPEEFAVEIVDTDDFTEYHLQLHPEDIGRVIGKKGRVVRAIRTIVYSVRVRNQKRARIVIADEVEEIDDSEDE
ncbi:KH domain-containing protein [Fundicoccus ignavus]|uniref:RNA-binding protein KhpA n=1 Tax=Fundicoccus ignavus TaxID=2664442 RepID=A0A6I2GIJ9_9LACT|nr:KH domain-containing protein [Fundicoccus ignavus]MRI81330.1 KH domain-containing protein [Fundicoccus ignavus]MRI85321.1 KH domain-containing protein [Fundicoccus ignavus]MRJ48073.1 KH domain-containing protein [Fundicoccus ignavus]